MSGTTEAVARVKIDALLEDAGWNLTDGSSVLIERQLSVLALQQGQSTQSFLSDAVNDLFRRHGKLRIA